MTDTTNDTSLVFSATPGMGRIAAQGLRAAGSSGPEGRRFIVLADLQQKFDRLLISENDQLQQYKMTPEGLSGRSTVASSAIRYPIASQVVVVKSEMTDKVLAAYAFVGSLGIHRLRRYLFRSDTMEYLLYRDGTDTNYIGDPVGVTSGTGYFVACITPSELHLYGTFLRNDSLDTRLVMKTSSFGSNAVNEGRGPWSGVTISTRFGNENEASVFVTGPYQTQEWRVYRDGNTLKTEKVRMNQPLEADLRKLSCLKTKGREGNRNLYKNLFSAGASGLINHFAASTANGDNWKQSIVSTKTGFGRAEVETVGDQLVLVARAGQRLYSFVATPNYDSQGGPRTWLALPTFGESVTSDPVLFWKLSRTAPQPRLVTAVEIANEGIQYFWYNGSRWMVGWP